MSKFSDKCKELLTENGYNVYRLSQAASLERTTLQRMVTGKRLPNQEFVENFCRALRISFSEEKEIMELYKMESIGETAYLNQKTILQLFHTLADLEKNESCQQLNVIEHGNLELLSPIANHSYDTEMLLQFILKESLAKEKKPVIYTNIPGTSTILSHYLKLLVPQYQKLISVKHLIYFQTNISSAYANLETLNQILPLCFSKMIDYKPYYYYSKLSKADQPNLIFPFYIMTGKYVLQLSGNHEKGILHSDSEIIKEYCKEFERCLQQSIPLLHQSQNITESLRLYLSNRSLPKNIITLESAPCDSDLISQEQFSDFAFKYASDLLHLLEPYTSFVNMIHHTKLKTFFTESGLNSFCSDGLTSGTSSIIFPPFSTQDRIKSLKHYIFNYENSEKTLLNLHFPFPRSMYIELRDKRTLYLIYTINKENISFITIHESSICDAFAEFFETLGTSEYVASDTYLQTLLKDNLNLLEKQL